MNQTIKITIQFLITGHSDKDWDLFLSSMQVQLNTVRYIVTEAMSNELIYDVNLRSVLDAFNEPHEETVSDLTITET